MVHADVPDPRLRAAAQADFEWAYELHKAALRDYVEQTWGWDETAQQRRFAETFDRAPRQVIEVAAEAVGVLVVDERRDEIYLGLVELLPAWQGRGLGTDILRWSLRRASETAGPSRCTCSRPTHARSRSTSARDCALSARRRCGC